MKRATTDARNKLLAYYNKTNPVYCIVAALDPRLNMKYFEAEKWTPELIKPWHDL
jgi:hypothetical protein